MSQNFPAGLRLGVIMALVLLFVGCETPEPTKEIENVISAGSVGISAPCFADELDLKLSAYPYDLKSRPMEYNAVVMELLSELSEQSVLLAVARGKHIDVSPDELARAEAEIKADYPGGSFDQMLLENAVSYMFWKRKLKQSLIIEKLIQSELLGPIEISGDDIKKFFHKYLDGNKASTDRFLKDEKKMVAQLRMEKSQEEYPEWMATLKEQIPFQIHKDVVTRFLIDPNSREEKVK
ncbi:MAG: SurA N-terminal domain-containing protein [Desulfovibrionales bacterium]|nr:SurA N-terminal domain-containing protein [Desulfovibrionales bacterium]